MATVTESGTSSPASMYRLASTPELGLLLQVGAEQVTGGDVRHVEPLGEPHRLGALARARRTDQNETHAKPPGLTM